MSAIFGVLRFDGRPPDPDDIARMGAALDAHGPDGGGTFASGPAALGRRVMHLGRDAGADSGPVRGAGGRVVLAADGRVDNRAELAAAVGVSAAHAQELTDSALLLRAYERFGQAFLEPVAGELAVAVWDAAARALVLATSAPLARPLCYHATAGRLAFASRPCGLFALPDIERRIDEERMAAFVARVPMDRSRSFFEGVRRLLPARLLVASGHPPAVRRWWRPDLGRELTLRSDDEYVEAFNEVLDRVIADQLRPDSALGVQLSGGLDSGAVAAVAAPRLAAAGRTLRAYTEVPSAGFDGPVVEGRYADEAPLVRALARMYPNVEPRFVTGTQGLLEGIDRFFDAAEIPFRNAANRAWVEEIYRSAAADGLDGLLTGEQGNYTISWDGSGLLPKLIRQGRMAAAAHEARALARAGRTRAPWRAMVGQGFVPLLPGVLGEVAQSARGRLAGGSARLQDASLINPDFAAEHALGKGARRRTPPDLGHAGGYGRALRLHDIEGSGSLAAEVQAGYRALHRVETFNPLADRRLVEFCLSVPEEQFAHGGRSRLLVRRAMEGRLPAETLGAAKRGLQAADWFERRSKERAKLLENVREFEGDDLTRRVLDLPRMRGLLERWPSAPPTDPTVVDLYRGALDLALMTGRFLRWAQAPLPLESG